MRRRRLWAGLTTAAVLTAVAAAWAQLSDESHAPPAPTRSSQMAEVLLQAGIKQADINDFAGAAATFKRVLDLDPNNKLAWYDFGVAAQHEGKTADARAAYDKALAIDPGYRPALFNKAVLIESSDTDQAVADLQHIVATDPKASTAYLQLGQALAKQGKDKDAQDAFTHAVQADPSLQTFVPDKFRGSVSASPTPTSSATQAGTHR